MQATIRGKFCKDFVCESEVVVGGGGVGWGGGAHTRTHIYTNRQHKQTAHITPRNIAKNHSGVVLAWGSFRCVTSHRLLLVPANQFTSVVSRLFFGASFYL